MWMKKKMKKNRRRSRRGGDGIECENCVFCDFLDGGYKSNCGEGISHMIEN